MEFIAKGFSALQELDRVIDHCEIGDKRLLPLLRTAKEHFELALEADNSNTHAGYWLSKMHLKYHFSPGANKAIGAALLVEAAEMGNPDAQYDLGCRLRAENPYTSEQQAFYYLEKAVDQVPESVTKFNLKRASTNVKLRKNDPIETAKEQFEIAASSRCDLVLKWLKLLDEEEKEKSFSWDCEYIRLN